MAAEIGAVWLRIDTIEVAISGARLEIEVADAGYRVAYALATDNLRLGLSVVADSVNPLAVTRQGWRQAAVDANASFVDVEVVCSDPAEHRRRVDSRISEIAGLVTPNWLEVIGRRYEPWKGARIVIDTAVESLGECVARLRAELAC
jgi:predicted kinase